MCGPPDPEMRNRPAANGTANRRASLEPQQNSEALSEIQVRSLRRHFAVGYCLAASLVPLIWGAGPR
jgi:hypothetical protein